MLIRFHSEAHADFTMFGDIGKQLIRLTGHSIQVPGAILAADASTALTQLKQALEQPPQPADAQKTTGPDDGEFVPAISLAKRAFPLIEMLGAAARDGKDVLWDYV
ncbi:DUF1840 domain-containing protein [Marinobacterium rhizophilum]|uniref:DUF1840 domain-containing protein n=1 Tax=Marinobacterium rhizophilum TaxID=420402 RepID=A0ABY5HLH5_9GAMM|nr:DUF1840 domain-containing protein [Marinobacterium rhizophilum]UTW13148.1 DUF1840 domain-containing protein [Marinobacterium rhizophilum]